MTIDNKKKEMMRSVQLEMLDAFANICNNNNLRYFLSGGTLLGAIRHKGFIPWDDDIDVAMPRQDYDKFCSIAASQIPANMFFQNMETETKYPYFFSKIRYNNTILIEPSFKNIDVHKGIYIDIFPIDGCSDNYKRAVKHVKKAIFYTKISLLYKTNISDTVKKKLKVFTAKIAFSFYKLFNSEKKFIKKLNNHYRKYKFSESNYTACLVAGYHLKELMKKDVFVDADGKLGNVEFCGKIYGAPINAHENLTSLYGDYMTPPPEGKRNSGHDVEDIIFLS